MELGQVNDGCQMLWRLWVELVVVHTNLVMGWMFAILSVQWTRPCVGGVSDAASKCSACYI